jgi:hypothetical protein
MAGAEATAVCLARRALPAASQRAGQYGESGLGVELLTPSSAPRAPLEMQ